MEETKHTPTQTHTHNHTHTLAERMEIVNFYFVVAEQFLWLNRQTRKYMYIMASSIAYNAYIYIYRTQYTGHDQRPNVLR